MLKDIFKQKNNVDKIKSTLADGYVDIKAYRYDENKNKKLVYHDTGDNVVTDWIKQSIMYFLAGEIFSDEGPENIDTSAFNIANGQSGSSTYDNINKSYYDRKNNVGTFKYPLYPTKISIGVGGANFTELTTNLNSPIKDGAKQCFVYFNKSESSNADNKNGDVFVSKQKDTDTFANKVTFKVTLPAQSECRFNDKTLNEIGLFNDNAVEGAGMPNGTLLAVKKFSAFTKDSSEEIVFTWSLTI